MKLRYKHPFLMGVLRKYFFIVKFNRNKLLLIPQKMQPQKSCIPILKTEILKSMVRQPVNRNGDEVRRVLDSVRVSGRLQ